MGAHACHSHSILPDTLQWRPTGVAPRATIRWPSHRVHNSFSSRNNSMSLETGTHVFNTHIFPLWISTTFAVTLKHTHTCTCLHTHSSFPRIHIVHSQASLIQSIQKSNKYKVHSILNSCSNSSFNSCLKVPSVLFVNMIYELNNSPFLKSSLKITEKAIPSCAHLLSPVILWAAIMCVGITFNLADLTIWDSHYLDWLPPIQLCSWLLFFETLPCPVWMSYMEALCLRGKEGPANELSW